MSKLLDYVTKTALANDESAVQEVIELMHPSDDPDVMGERFNEMLGYNPITYYDEKEIDEMLKHACAHISAVSQEIIRENSPQIISEIMNCFDSKKSGYLADAIIATVPNFISMADVELMANELGIAFNSGDEDDEDDDDEGGIVTDEFDIDGDIDSLDDDFDDI